jgi:hypothetical protein
MMFLTPRVVLPRSQERTRRLPAAQRHLEGAKMAFFSFLSYFYCIIFRKDPGFESPFPIFLGKITGTL